MGWCSWLGINMAQPIRKRDGIAEWGKGVYGWFGVRNGTGQPGHLQ